ncbi:hypothetical protein BGY98DRAFT_513354 [Russula aff. rugulosa BPL654]|nr:hypothetical protein BGY98DRAFT_513354 [Russula aff. rugulosa BPL654]
MDVLEQMPEGWTAIQWWGYNSQRYHPAWGSLARDYLSIMSSSVSSELEALQCVKCMIRHDLLFQEPAPSSKVEAEETGHQELEDAGAEGDSRGQPVREESDVEDVSWDGLLIEDEDEE